jgi:translation initiation factor IF-3
LDAGDKVKLSCQFRGRENDFREIGRVMFMKFLDDVGPAMGLMEGNPTMEAGSAHTEP